MLDFFGPAHALTGEAPEQQVKVAVPMAVYQTSICQELVNIGETSAEIFFVSPSSSSGLSYTPRPLNGGFTEYNPCEHDLGESTKHWGELSTVPLFRRAPLTILQYISFDIAHPMLKPGNLSREC
jgi:hypothetical protein